MNDQTSQSDMIALSQVTFRAALGILGMWLPAILLAGGLIFHRSVETSISAYYHLGPPAGAYHPAMGDIFVGFLFLMGLALIFYQGYQKKDDERVSDNQIGNVAGISAIAVALIPTDDTKGFTVDIVGDVHFAFAALFFVCLIIFCWSVFTRSDQAEADWKEGKRRRNRIYKRCAIIMGVAIVLIAVVSFLFPALKEEYKAVFWLESVAVMTFGYAWWVKANTTYSEVWRRLRSKTQSAAPEPPSAPGPTAAPE